MRHKTMTNAIKTVSALALVITLSGCLCIADHVGASDRFPYRPYQSTRGLASCIACPFKSGKCGEEAIAQAYCTVLLPVTLVSLPVEAVADTVTLPYDLYASSSAPAVVPLGAAKEPEFSVSLKSRIEAFFWRLGHLLGLI